MGSVSSSVYHGKIYLTLKKKIVMLSLLLKQNEVNFLSNSLRGHIAKIIHPDQTGFIPNRHIYFNMRGLFNMYNPVCSKEDSAVISLNAEKVFEFKKVLRFT